MEMRMADSRSGSYRMWSSVIGRPSRSATRRVADDMRHEADNQERYTWRRLEPHRTGDSR
jgi:hypothetical protein